MNYEEELVDYLEKYRIFKDISINGKRIEDLYNVLGNTYFENMSQYFFNQDIIAFYPYIREGRAKNNITCDFSGGRIKKGSIYCAYRPFLEDLTTGECYVLKRTLKVETGYISYLPTSITELEHLNEKIENYYQNREEGIDFSHLYQVTGGGLKLQKLKKRNIHKNCG